MLLIDTDIRMNEIARMINGNAHEKGFYDTTETEDQYIERLCNNLHDEVSELHEAWRNGKLHEPCDKADKMEEAGILPMSCLEEELADIIIRAFDNAVQLGIDITSAVLRKHAFNQTRSYRHGNKRS